MRLVHKSSDSRPHHSEYLSKDQLEDIIEDEVTALSVRKELESLAVVHGSLLLINLEWH